MKRFFRNLTTILTVLLLNSFSFATHAAAMPMPAHDMQGMNHGAGSSNSTSLNCETLCRTAVVKKEDLAPPLDDKEDDEPELPYYAQHQTWPFSDPLAHEKRYAETVKPPPKIGVYILYGVFRV